MDNLVEFKDLMESDFQTIKEIYDYYILNSTATWHTEPISIAELQGTIYIAHPRYKSYLVYHGNQVVGYCYFSEYKKRQAYYRSSEVTIYLKNGFEHQGFGTSILKRMEEEAKCVGFHNLVAVISGDNIGSIHLFEKNGYEKCAHLKNLGEKFGKLLDIVCYQHEI